MFRCIREAVDANGKALTANFGALWALLLKSIYSAKMGAVACILDALDECRDRERQTIVQKLERFSGLRSNTSIKFLVTSRPYQRIIYDFQSMTDRIPSIRLAGEEESSKLNAEID